MTEFSIYLNGPLAVNAEVLRLHSDKMFAQQKITDLNRLLASYKSENEKLKNEIANLKKAGDSSVIELTELLAVQAEANYPDSRTTHQRREIANLHKVIKRLKEQIDG